MADEPKKPGNPSEYPPEIMAELERRWCKTTLPQLTIARDMGVPLATYRNMAQRLGWLREGPGQGFLSPTAIQEQARRRAWETWAYGPRRQPDNPVRLVPPETHKAPAGRYRMGGT